LSGDLQRCEITDGNISPNIKKVFENSNPLDFITSILKQADIVGDECLNLNSNLEVEISLSAWKFAGVASAATGETEMKSKM
jgi:hypothetical protein